MTSIVAPGQLPLLPLHTLGWKGFQDLSGTVLREVLGQTFTVWSHTNDAGRDGAFVGLWSPRRNETLSGHFVAQSKHTSAADSTLTLSLLNEEFAKVARLVAEGRADVYLLFTNHRVTGEMELAAGRMLADRGIKEWRIFGDHWLSAQVYESPRLRALVPRVYGIGDLAEIVDARAYEQARAVLSSLEDEIKTFVPVEAYRRAYTALEKHGFVFLVGEPGSGKSTIAAILTLLAADLWRLAPVRVQSPQDFQRHWNPGRGDQIFWIDDAFGDTQYEWAKSTGWRALSRELRAALKAGARIVMTTRDYIFRRAMNDFRKGDLPVSDLVQVQIAVEEMTLSEKESILYNHVKLGTQPKAFRTAVKTHLPLVAVRAHMLPEVAKRLATPLFTGRLALTADGIASFASDPDQYLLEVLRGLGRADRAAMITLFSHGGTVKSPISAEGSMVRLLELLGSDIAEFRDGFAALRNTLVRLVVVGDGSYWTYRHPTIHDAVSTYVALDPELVGTYLRVADVRQVVTEVYFEQAQKPRGARVAVPRHMYKELADRIVARFDANERLPDDVIHFLAYRADDEFVRVYATAAKNLQHQLLEFWSYLDASREVSVLERLSDLGLLMADTRRQMVQRIKSMAVETPDPGWIGSSLLTQAEQSEILAHVRGEFVDDTYTVVINWKFNYDRSESPDDYFDPLVRAVRKYIDAFKEAGDQTADATLEQMQENIAGIISELEEDYRPPAESLRHAALASTPPAKGLPVSEASRFDDLDE